MPGTGRMRSLCFALMSAPACDDTEPPQLDAAEGMGSVELTWTFQLNGSPATCMDIYPATHVRLDIHDDAAVVATTTVVCTMTSGTIASVPAGAHSAQLCLFYQYPGETDHCYGTGQATSFDVLDQQTVTVTDVVVSSCDTGGLPHPC